MRLDIEQNASEHRAGFPCPVCHVITVRQPWASLIALGFKHYEFRSRKCYHEGAVVIHAASNWYSRRMREIVREHFDALGMSNAIDALFPLRVPVADARVVDCIPVTHLDAQQRQFGGRNPEDYGLKLADVR